MSEHERQAGAPWYKEPWMIFVVAVPAIAVVAGIAMITIAVVGRDTLVRDNYYKDGLAINQELDMENRAKMLGLHAELEIDNQTGVIAVRVMSNDAQPGQLLMSFLHPTMAEKDQDIILYHIKAGHYTGKRKANLDGRYHLQLTSAEQQWRLKAYRVLGAEERYSLP